MDDEDHGDSAFHAWLPDDGYRRDGRYVDARGRTDDPVSATLFHIAVRNGLDGDALAVGHRRDAGAGLQVYRSRHSSEGAGLIGFPFRGPELDDMDEVTDELVRAATAAAESLAAMERRDEMLGERGLTEGIPDRMRDPWQFRVHRLVALLFASGRKGMSSAGVTDQDRQHVSSASASRLGEHVRGYHGVVVSSHEGQRQRPIQWSFMLSGLYAYAGIVMVDRDHDMEIDDSEKGTYLRFETDRQLPGTIVNAAVGLDLFEVVAVPHLTMRRAGIRIEAMSVDVASAGRITVEMRLEDVTGRLARPPRNRDMGWQPAHRSDLRGLID